MNYFSGPRIRMGITNTERLAYDKIIELLIEHGADVNVPKIPHFFLIQNDKSSQLNFYFHLN